MIKTVDTVVIYERLLSISQHMIAAAEQRDWKNLEDLEALYSQQIDRLKACATTEPLNPDLNGKVELLLTELIKSNQKLFDITQPWQNELALKVSSIDTEQKLHQAYNN
ncbi:MAG: flagellar protein FliT [Methylococcaceae bacterium]